MKKNFDCPLKLSIIYYINNIPLLNIQNMQQKLELQYKCNITYFDIDFFFLQVDWPYSIFKNTTVSTFKNNIILADISSKQSFLLPVGVIFNGAIVPFSYFINLLGEDENITIYEEILKNYVNPSNLILGNLGIFSFSPTKQILSLYDENNFDL